MYTEVYNGSAGITLNVPLQTTLRVSAGADVTITIDGKLACTLRAGEVEFFNVGSGWTPGNTTVPFVVGAGDVRVQQASELDPGRKAPISY
jgi:hypothetical protein